MAFAGVELVTGILPVGSVAVTVFAGMLLTKFPAVTELTLSVTVQEPKVVPEMAGTVPPLNDTTVPPGFAVTVPPQVLVTFGEAAINNPD